MPWKNFYERSHRFLKDPNKVFKIDFDKVESILKMLLSVARLAVDIYIHMH